MRRQDAEEPFAGSSRNRHKTLKRHDVADRRASVSYPSDSESSRQTSLYYLRPEDKKRLLEKVNRLLNEHKIEEACRLMVAIAFVNMDADAFVNGLLDEIKKYKERSCNKERSCTTSTASTP